MPDRDRWRAALAVASLVAGGLAATGSGGAGDPLPASPSVVTTDMLLHAAASGDWLMYGGNYWNDRYSPLKTITTANAKNLIPRAVFTHGAERLGGFETTPIVVGGIMDITSPPPPNNIGRAVDLRTNKRLRQHGHKHAPVTNA